MPRRVRQAPDLGDGFVGAAAIDHVEAPGQRTVVAAGLLPALVGQCLHVAQGGVGEGDGGRVGHGSTS